ncbi:MAG: hypothetical protein ACQSGP_23720 [Frankia sp.]
MDERARMILSRSKPPATPTEPSKETSAAGAATGSEDDVYPAAPAPRRAVVPWPAGAAEGAGREAAQGPAESPPGDATGSPTGDRAGGLPANPVGDRLDDDPDPPTDSGLDILKSVAAHSADVDYGWSRDRTREIVAEYHETPTLPEPARRREAGPLLVAVLVMIAALSGFAVAMFSHLSDGTTAAASGAARAGGAGEHAPKRLAGGAALPPQATVSAPFAGTAPTHVATTGTVVGENPWWNEDDVIVTAAGGSGPRGMLTAFQTTISVALTPGLTYANSWNTFNKQSFVSSVTTSGDRLVYHYLYTGGPILGTTWTVAAQQHGTGTLHPTGGDTYTVTATFGGGAPVTLTGHF